jgi:hypothetical protein
VDDYFGFYLDGLFYGFLENAESYGLFASGGGEGDGDIGLSTGDGWGEGFGDGDGDGEDWCDVDPVELRWR